MVGHPRSWAQLLFFKTACGGNIDFASNDRLDPLSFTGFVKVDGPMHISMVGQSDGGIPSFFALDAISSTGQEASKIEY